MRSDLHVHTHFSDSNFSVRRTMELAQKRGLDCIAITDHDTVAGVPMALALGQSLGVKCLPGVEISGFDFQRQKKAHILGYTFCLDAPSITELCSPLLKRRRENALWQIEMLIKLGYSITLDEVLEKSQHSASIYKPHLLAVLLEKGYGQSDYHTLYQTLFSKGAPCAREILYVDVRDAIRAVKNDGGIAIFAHPGQQDSFDLIDELWECGLDGIELHHCDNSSEDKERILTLAKRRPMILTAGSDFHGNYGSKVELGDVPATHSPLFGSSERTTACRNLGTYGRA